jgi:hypothetical protein
VAVTFGCDIGAGAGAGIESPMRSKRSLLRAGGGGLFAAGAGDAKSPKPLKDCCFTAGCGGLDTSGGDVGASKKLPPGAKDDVAGFGAVCRRLFAPLSKPAKADGFAACCAGWPKSRPENASVMPPNADEAAGDRC